MLCRVLLGHMCLYICGLVALVVRLILRIFNKYFLSSKNGDGFLHHIAGLSLALLVGGFFSFGLTTQILVLGLRLFPDLEISLSNRDQLATLLIGVVTLSYTIFKVVLSCQKQHQDALEVVEIEPLTLSIGCLR
jgi:hypothetical protein